MERVTLKVETRQDIGKGAARSLRRKGFIPCVIYRKGAATSLQIPRKELVQYVNMSAGEQMLVNLQFSDGSMKLALIKDYQVDPIKGELLHTDFYEVSLQEKVKVTVSVLLVGIPIGVKRDGGILQPGLREVEIECLPDSIPAHIEVDVSGLGLAHALHVRDIVMAEGIKVHTEPAETIAIVLSSAQLASEAAGAGEEKVEPEVIKKGKPETKEK